MDYLLNYEVNEEDSESIPDYEQCSTRSRDPLDNLGNDIEEPKVYRMDCVVFAEPLKININSKADSDTNILEDNDAISIDNIMIMRKKGRRNKYIINMEENSLTCPQQQCQKEFPSTTLLKAHIRKVHCSEKVFVCEQCGASFTAQYLLNRHYSVHSKEKIQCPVCNKFLSKRTNLRVHLRSHADTRPHECPICHKRFLRRSTMNVHLNFVHKTDAKEKERSVLHEVENPKEDESAI